MATLPRYSDTGGFGFQKHAFVSTTATSDESCSTVQHREVGPHDDWPHPPQQLPQTAAPQRADLSPPAHHISSYCRLLNSLNFTDAGKCNRVLRSSRTSAGGSLPTFFDDHVTSPRTSTWTSTFYPSRPVHGPEHLHASCYESSLRISGHGESLLERSWAAVQPHDNLLQYIRHRCSRKAQRLRIATVWLTVQCRRQLSRLV
jgi:hypothetical protein